MSPDDTDKKPGSDQDKEKDKRELIVPPDKYSEASKRMGGDPTTDAPAPVMREDKAKAIEVVKKESQEDNKTDNKEDSKATKED